MTYYFMLYDEISYLEESNIELVLLYVIDVLSNATTNEDETQMYVNKKLFATFGNHLLTEQIKKEFLNLACKIVNRHQKRDFAYFSAYDQLVNSVESERKEKVKEVVLKNTSTFSSQKFYEGYNNGDFLPF